MATFLSRHHTKTHLPYILVVGTAFLLAGCVVAPIEPLPSPPPPPPAYGYYYHPGPYYAYPPYPYGPRHFYREPEVGVGINIR